ncbi:MAG: hypothetical protein WKF96_00715 [Solirubrobacteraceae bacterium]
MSTLGSVMRVGTAALCLVLAGCGGNKSSTQPAPSAARNLDLVFGDCSSFRRYAEAFVPEMVTIAETSAAQRRTLWAGCFDGAPLRTLHWKPKIDFNDLPIELRGSARLAARVNLARALGLKTKLEQMVRSTPTRVPGSGQLEALELAAHTEHVGRVFLFTDGVINQIDGVGLDRATLRQINQVVDRWAPRLAGLKHVELTFVGVGRGTRSTAGLRRAEALFRQLAARVGVRSFVWQLELPADIVAAAHRIAAAA